MERYQPLDQLRGIAVIWIHLVDLFFLLWNRSSGFDFYGGYLFDQFPIYAFPPILFSFSTGLSITLWKEKHDYKYLFRRLALLFLSGLILSYWLDGNVEAWGLFEMIALTNLVLFYLDSKFVSMCGIAVILTLNGLKPPFFAFHFPKVHYFFEFEAMPFIISQALVSGLFPLIPFLAWGFWGCLVSKYRNNLLRISLIPIGLGLMFRIFQPFIYNQYGNVYSTSMILLMMGISSLLLYLLDKIRVPTLNVYGKYAWRLTFWRYPTLYLPFIWFGMFQSLNYIEAFIVSTIFSLALILLTKVKV